MVLVALYFGSQCWFSDSTTYRPAADHRGNMARTCPSVLIIAVATDSGFGSKGRDLSARTQSELLSLAG